MFNSSQSRSLADVLERLRRVNVSDSWADASSIMRSLDAITLPVKVTPRVGHVDKLIAWSAVYQERYNCVFYGRTNVRCAAADVWVRPKRQISARKRSITSFTRPCFFLRAPTDYIPSICAYGGNGPAPGRPMAGTHAWPKFFLSRPIKGTNWKRLWAFLTAYLPNIL